MMVSGNGNGMGVKTMGSLATVIDSVEVDLSE
jgi:hypothetical protein